MSFPVIIICQVMLLNELTIDYIKPVLLLRLWPIFRSILWDFSPPRYNRPHGSRLQGEHGGESDNQEADEGSSEVCCLGGTGSMRTDRTEWVSVRNSGMRAGWHSRHCAGWGHLERSISHLQQGRETTGAEKREPVSSHLIALCGGWDKVRALPPPISSVVDAATSALEGGKTSWQPQTAETNNTSVWKECVKSFSSNELSRKKEKLMHWLLFLN